MLPILFISLYRLCLCLICLKAVYVGSQSERKYFGLTELTKSAISDHVTREITLLVLIRRTLYGIGQGKTRTGQMDTGIDLDKG